MTVARRNQQRPPLAVLPEAPAHRRTRALAGLLDQTPARAREERLAASRRRYVPAPPLPDPVTVADRVASLLAELGRPATLRFLRDRLGFTPGRMRIEEIIRADGRFVPAGRMGTVR